jgi:3-phenylpropionate/trans-cinnamate dioxygenase ferredoxin subunit
MRLRVGMLEDLPDGAGTKVEDGETRIAVFRIGDDLYAIGDRCSHAEASLAEGELFGTEVECPRHGAEFDLITGKPGSLPATKPVSVYPAEVRGGSVFVTLPDTPLTSKDHHA